MFEKIQHAMKVYGMLLPAAVRAVILELGAEVDRLRTEVDSLRSQINERK